MVLGKYINHCNTPKINRVIQISNTVSPCVSQAPVRFSVLHSNVGNHVPSVGGQIRGGGGLRVGSNYYCIYQIRTEYLEPLPNAALTRQASQLRNSNK